MKISEILWRAANKYLWSGAGDYLPSNDLNRRYSCDAIYMGNVGAYEEKLAAISFVEELGVSRDSLDEFEEFDDGPTRQGARYAWLMFASMYAEEQGL